MWNLIVSVPDHCLFTLLNTYTLAGPHTCALAGLHACMLAGFNACMLAGLHGLAAICWERSVPLTFHLCCFYFSAVLIVGVPFPFGV